MNSLAFLQHRGEWPHHLSFAGRMTTSAIADHQPSKRLNLQGWSFSSITCFASVKSHDFPLVTKTARADRPAPFHSDLSISASQHVHLHSLQYGTPYCEHLQQFLPFVALDDDGFQLVRPKKRNRLQNCLPQMPPTKIVAKYFVFKQKTLLSQRSSLADNRIPS